MPSAPAPPAHRRVAPGLRRSARLLGLTLLVALAGCTRTAPAEAMFSAYAAALGALAGADARPAQGDGAAPAPTRAQALPLPRTRARRFDLPRHEVGIGEWYRLRHCRLGALVSQRNSALGRVMADSVRWIYEQRFLAAADDCPLPPELAPRIAPVIAAKRGELPRHRWNAFWAGPEVARLAHFEAGPPPLDGPGLPPSATLAALDRVTALLSAPAPASAQAPPGPAADPPGSAEDPPGPGLDTALSRIGAEALVGSSLLGFTLALNGLDDANRALAAALAAGRPDRCPVEPAQVAEVFRTHYMQQVQPWLVRLQGRGAPVLAALHRLYRVTAAGVEPGPAMRAFAAQLDPEHAEAPVPRTHAALRLHTQRWQHLLARCRLNVTDLARDE